MAFPQESAAIAYCEGIDVEDGMWLFFDGNGRALEAVFTRPNTRDRVTVSSGEYFLRPAAEGSAPSLLEYLPTVAVIESTPPLDAVAAIERLLADRSRRPDDDAPSLA